MLITYYLYSNIDRERITSGNMEQGNTQQWSRMRQRTRGRCKQFTHMVMRWGLNRNTIWTKTKNRIRGKNQMQRNTIRKHYFKKPKAWNWVLDSGTRIHGQLFKELQKLKEDIFNSKFIESFLFWYLVIVWEVSQLTPSCLAALRLVKLPQAVGTLMFSVWTHRQPLSLSLFPLKMIYSFSLAFLFRRKALPSSRLRFSRAG